MEIVFTTQRGRTYYLSSTMTEQMMISVINEKMLVVPGIGDLENDGSIDIVICTWDDNIYAIDDSGNIKPGFPFLSTNRFNSPPTLVDIDNDGDLEIVAGNDSGYCIYCTMMALK